MRHLQLLGLGAALIFTGLLVSVILQLGGPWTMIGVALEIAGVAVLAVNIFLMMKNRTPGGPPR